VLENARRKAAAGEELWGGRELPVLGVDTDVALDGRLLGKPAGEAGARERLETLSGRTHQVLSGVCIREGGEERTGIARTDVRFVQLGAATIDLYLRSGEWRDRAGAYAIQGLGSILVGGLQGDFSNVVGLPITLLLQLAPNLMEGPENPKAKIYP
jgi:septum formation protein